MSGTRIWQSSTGVWFWQTWYGGKLAARGSCDSEQEAQRKADVAADRLEGWEERYLAELERDLERDAVAEAARKLGAKEGGDNNLTD